MGLVVLLLSLLVALPASAQAVTTDVSCAGQPSNVACWTADYVAMNDATLSAYNSGVTAYPAIADAINGTGYQTMPQFARQAVWDSITEASLNSCAITVALPASYPVDDTATTGSGPVGYTPAEAADSYGAKVAHALCHDIANSFKWHLSDWPAQYLDGLFDPQRIYYPDCGQSSDPPSCWTFDWNGTLTTTGTFAAFDPVIVDYSPTETMTAFLAIVNVTGETLPSKLGPDQMLWWAIERAEDFGHSRSGDQATAVSFARAVDITVNQKPGTSWPGGSDYFTATARGGCHFTSPWIAAALRSVNIPAYFITGFEYGRGHASMFAPVLNRVVLHGDDPYLWDGLAQNNLELIAPLTFWDKRGDRDLGWGMTNQALFSTYTVAKQKAITDQRPVDGFVHAYGHEWIDSRWPYDYEVSAMCTTPGFWQAHKIELQSIAEPCQSQIVTDAYNTLVALSGCDNGGF